MAVERGNETSGRRRRIVSPGKDRRRGSISRFSPSRIGGARGEEEGEAEEEEEDEEESLTSRNSTKKAPLVKGSSRDRDGAGFPAPPGRRGDSAGRSIARAIDRDAEPRAPRAASEIS
uniref:Uncharacterized protein n=1 Tax=Oryza brachyantha TaxID=4533 RepID=J3LGC2_ORYBR